MGPWCGPRGTITNSQHHGACPIPEFESDRETLSSRCAAPYVWEEDD